jgi:hypothetical protein
LDEHILDGAMIVGAEQAIEAVGHPRYVRISAA